MGFLLFLLLLLIDFNENMGAFEHSPALPCDAMRREKGPAPNGVGSERTSSPL